MSDDPKRIWLEPKCCVDPYGEIGRSWCEDPSVFGDCEDGNSPVEYLRANHAADAADQIERQAARIRELEADYSDALHVAYLQGYADGESKANEDQCLSALTPAPVTVEARESAAKAVCERHCNTWAEMDEEDRNGYLADIDVALRALTGERE